MYNQPLIKAALTEVGISVIDYNEISKRSRFRLDHTLPRVPVLIVSC